jgi:hypothetical protein
MTHASDRKILRTERELYEAGCFIPFFAPRPIRKAQLRPFTPYFAPRPVSDKNFSARSAQDVKATF